MNVAGRLHRGCFLVFFMVVSLVSGCAREQRLISFFGLDAKKRTLSGVDRNVVSLTRCGVSSHRIDAFVVLDSCASRNCSRLRQYEWPWCQKCWLHAFSVVASMERCKTLKCSVPQAVRGAWSRLSPELKLSAGAHCNMMIRANAVLEHA